MFTLLLWTVVAAGSSGRIYTDWRPVAHFSTAEQCRAAAADLNALDRYRCLPTVRP